jgi:hypothetical protein
MPPRALSVDRFGFGLAAMVQRDPFQDSARVRVPTAGVVYEPTAMQRTALMQEIALSTLDSPCLGDGADTADRDLPFQRAASTPPLAGFGPAEPTIRQSPLLRHETAEPLLKTGTGIGLCGRCRCWPADVTLWPPAEAIAAGAAAAAAAVTVAVSTASSILLNMVPPKSCGFVKVCSDKTDVA